MYQAAGDNMCNSSEIALLEKSQMQLLSHKALCQADLYCCLKAILLNISSSDTSHVLRCG